MSLTKQTQNTVTNLVIQDWDCCGNKVGTPTIVPCHNEDTALQVAARHLHELHFDNETEWGGLDEEEFVGHVVNNYNNVFELSEGKLGFDTPSFHTETKLVEF